MLPLRYALRWQALSAALLLLVLAGTLMPAIWFWPDRVRVLGWLDNLDKWAHLLTFAFLAVWFTGPVAESYPAAVIKLPSGRRYGCRAKPLNTGRWS